MATMREADTALWLHNKLSSDDMWSGTNIWSSLTKDVLRNTQECFHTLESPVKIKLLMSFLYIPRRSAEELRSELNEILEIGCNDSDEWVRILSEILRNFPETGNLNVDLENVSPIFSEIVQDLKQTMSNTKNTLSLLPLECPYLNRGALVASMGVQLAPPKHFTLRRKPKSAALRAELFQKATESSSSQKRVHSSVTGASSAASGLRRSDSTGKSPSKQTPSLSRLSSHNKSTSGAATSVLRHGLSAASLKQQNRTAKLLDINEQPIGGNVREAKRRKKLQAEIELSEDDKKKKDLGKTQEPATPEYAIGLTAPTEVSQATTSNTQLPTPVTPSYASMAGLTRQPHLPSTTSKPDTTPVDASLSANFNQELQMHLEREREIIRRRTGMQAAAATTSGHQPTTGITSSFKPSVSLQPATVAAAPSAPGVGTTRNVPTAPVNSSNLSNQPKRDLKLTREQMLAAQEMFRGANKVTKPEKALILGFMAGARENPFPNQGPVITIKLSEHTEDAKDISQTQLVEMLFEMNYDTGHWRRLKRTRVLARQQPVNQGNQ